MVTLQFIITLFLINLALSCCHKLLEVIKTTSTLGAAASGFIEVLQKTLEWVMANRR